MIGFLYYVAMTAAALMKLEGTKNKIKNYIKREKLVLIFLLESNEWAKAYLLSFLCDFYLL